MSSVVEDATVFRALADASRRRILDLLRENDGQSVSELSQRFTLSRYAVMKHLRILGDAGLVVQRRDGRHTRSFLNAVPIRQIHDRWISRYAEPWVGGLTATKRMLEEETMGSDLGHLYEIYIRATPQQL